MKQKWEILLETIKRYCIECSGGSRFEAKNCGITECSLHNFRNGEFNDSPIQNNDTENNNTEII